MIDVDELHGQRVSSILLIDDDANNLAVLVDYLSEHGFELMVARDGETGLRLAREYCPDLILLDVHLPGIDGFEVCRRLKADEVTREISVLFMTSSTGTGDKLHGFEAGGLDYITKPFQQEEVLARVTTQLRSQRLTRELEAAKEDLERRVAERTAELAHANADLHLEVAERRRAEQTTEQLNRELAFRALHDDLTGLPNRAMLMDHLRTAVTSAQQSGNLVGVLFIDLDDFKSVNDGFGHLAADGFLVQVGQRISASLRRSNIVSRVGGDEFVVVCGDLTDSAEMHIVEQRIRSALSANIPVSDRWIGAPASIGVAISTPESTPEDLLREADSAMFESKRRALPRWGPRDSFGHTAATRMLSVETELREAMQTDQLRVHYQPTIDLRTMRIVGVEALLRWQHPQRGLLPPKELIEVAERRGLIGEIGSWVLQTACRQAVAWHRQFGDEAPWVAVNVSSRQLGGQGIAAEVKRILAAGLAPEHLRIEITESQFVSVDSEAIADLLSIRGEGVGIAVDDFGTGFAGFDYLRRLPVTSLKIDQSFVQGLGTDRTDTAIVAAVITLANNLGLDTIAEGVETVEQRDQIYDLGCANGQGWLWHKAMPADQVDQLISDQQRHVQPPSA